MRRSVSATMKSWVLLCLALGFMLCVFAPLDAFFANGSEYWFNLSHLLPVCAISFAAVFLILAVIGLGLAHLKFFPAIYALFLVLLVALYIQGNYIPRPYGVFNGAEIDWNAPEYRWLSIVGIALFAIGFAAWVAIAAISAARKRIVQIGDWICLILIGIQLLSLPTLYFKYLSQENSGPNLAVTSDKMLELSATNNVLVVLLDSFDGQYLQEILAGDEREFAQGVLRDFTFYPDTLGKYPTTKGALPHILTGVLYTNEVPFADYVRRAYEGNPLADAFIMNHYSVGVYTSPKFLSAAPDAYENVVRQTFSVARPAAFASTLYKLVAFNYSPHDLRKFFMVNADDFMQYRRSQSTSKPFSESNHAFYDAVTKNDGIVVGTEMNVFRFYHLRGTHPPARYGKDLEEVKGRKPTYVDESLGCLTLLKAFVDQLRNVGAYDVSTIIVMADHGNIGKSQNPIFMVKNQYENHEFRVSDAKMSYDYLFNLLLARIRDGAEISEESIKRYAARNPQRTFLYYQWDNIWSRNFLPIIEEMVLDSGTAAVEEGASFEKTGTTYGGFDDRPYILGTPLQFGWQGSANDFIVKGMWGERGFHRTLESETTMCFKLVGKIHRLSLDLEFMSTSGKIGFDVFANGELIGSHFAYGHYDERFDIPASCIGRDKKLSLKLVSKASEDDGASEVSMNNASLPLRLYSMRISAGDKKQTLSFGRSEGATAYNHCVTGASRPERDYAWTNGDILTMRFHVPKDDQKKPFRVKLEYVTFLPREHIIVSSSGRIIDDYVAEGKETRTFKIPPECFGDNGDVELSLKLPDAISLRELGRGGDTRRLALQLRRITLQ